MKGIDNTAQQLIETIYSASELKKVSVYLESLTLSPGFKNQIKKVAQDEELTDKIRKKEMLELFDQQNQPTIYRFFERMFDSGEFWLFASDHFDYFDQFVQSFQMQTEKIVLIHLVTALEIQDVDLVKMSEDLTKSIGKHVILHIQVDPTILGGAQVRMGNLIFDYTLKAKFSQFKRQWISKLVKTSELVGRS